MKKKINNLLKKASNLSKKSRSKYFYPLLEDAFFEEDIFSAIEVLLSKNYGEHLGFKDAEYKEIGANIVEDENKIINEPFEG